MGQLRMYLFDPLVQKIRNKVASWKGKMLSQRGRLVPIRHVLSSMVTHILAVLPVLHVVLQKSNLFFRPFFGVRAMAKANVSGVPI